MTTYGFIGAGNMAGAIVRGAIAAGTDPAFLLLTSAHDSAARLAAQTGARHEPDAGALAAAADVVVLAVKPRVVPVVAARISDALAVSRPLVVSIAAGIGLARLESLLPEGARIVRAMPNMAAGVGQSMTALAAGSAAAESDLAAARALMDSVGRTVLIAEEDFPVFVGLAGSAPAFVFTCTKPAPTSHVETLVQHSMHIVIATEDTEDEFNLVARLSHLKPQLLLHRTMPPEEVWRTVRSQTGNALNVHRTMIEALCECHPILVQLYTSIITILP